MAFRSRRVPVRSLAVALAGLLLLSAGCSEPEAIKVADEPKPVRPAVPTAPPDQQKFRTLAAMFPTHSGEPGREVGQWWFIKFTGPADVVAKHEPAFRALVESVLVRTGEAEPITWDLPPGWTRAEGKEGFGRYATLKVEGPDSPTEVTVSRAGGTVLDNVNRWRTQVGLEPVAASALDMVTTLRPINGRLAVLVDMAGPKEPVPPKNPGPGTAPQ